MLEKEKLQTDLELKFLFTARKIIVDEFWPHLLAIAKA